MFGLRDLLLYIDGRHHLAYSWCIILKFESTNQDSAGGKNFTALTSTKVIRNRIEIKQLYPNLKDSENFSMAETHQLSRKGKNPSASLFLKKKVV